MSHPFCFHGEHRVFPCPHGLGSFDSGGNGKLKIRGLEVSVPGPGMYRVDVFLTHTHPNGDPLGGIEPFTTRDILLACQPALFITLEAED